MFESSRKLKELFNSQVADGDADRSLSIGALLEGQAIIPHYRRVNEIEEGCSHSFDYCPDYIILPNSVMVSTTHFD